MAKRISKAKREEAEQLLGEAQAYQTAFWKSLSRLEKSLGIEIESTSDLEGWTIEDLLETWKKQQLSEKRRNERMESGSIQRKIHAMLKGLEVGAIVRWIDDDVTGCVERDGSITWSDGYCMGPSAQNDDDIQHLEIVSD